MHGGTVFLDGRVVPEQPAHWWPVGVGTAMTAFDGERIVAVARVLALCEVPAHFTRDAARFASEAMAFCDFVERAHEVELVPRLALARDRLLSLYAAACTLPEVFADGSDVELADLPSWPGFGDREHYAETLEPYDLGTTALGIGDLSDDLLEVYREVKSGLLLWERSEVAAAIWTWRDGFQIHWGVHATSALRALHWACDASE